MQQDTSWFGELHIIKGVSYSQISCCFFLLLHFYPLKVQLDKSGNIWEVSPLEIIQGLDILILFPRGEIACRAPFITKGIFLITEPLFLKRHLLLLFIPPEVTILCHRTIISTATDCDVTSKGRRNVSTEKRKRMFSSTGKGFWVLKPSLL